MTRTYRIILVAMFVLVATMLAQAVHADTAREATRYRLRAGSGPAHLVVRAGCLNAEDSAAVLILVNDDPAGDGRMVYRCVKP